MKTYTFNKFLGKLLNLDSNQSQIISCFVNLETGHKEGIRDLEIEFSELCTKLAGKPLKDFEAGQRKILTYLTNELKISTKSAVIYVRSGDGLVFEAMQFVVPFETQVIVDKLPHIYPLIELKDIYHRFVIVITTETHARILETTIGSVTEEILTARPDLRQRIGREWTREHYRNHKHERELQFVREKIRIVDELISRRGHNYLIVAGSPKMVSLLTEALPDRLKKKLISKFTSNPKSGLGPILRNSILEFSNSEKLESHDRVVTLESAVLGNGLGVSGFDASHEALIGGYADVLIIDQEFQNLAGREELVRLATRNKIQIETVDNSEKLRRFGGVGCLLRFKPYLVGLDTSN